MPLEPTLGKRSTTYNQKQCNGCKRELYSREFLISKSPLDYDGTTSLCRHCIDVILKRGEYKWELVDHICQAIDIPFVPRKWEEFLLNNDSDPFGRYADFFAGAEYYEFSWYDYQEEYARLKKEGLLEYELPLISDARRNALKQKWGFNYDDEALSYLENLYDGMLATQNINGATQGDQVIKFCKISYEIDECIRRGEAFDKLLSSYEKLSKLGEFTPKNVKNLNDFDSIGELVKWFEKKGWKNKFYDNVSRDVVDETMKNIEAFNQRLYVNETGIGDEITRRIEALKSLHTTLQSTESYYGTDADYDLDNYDNDGYESLLKDWDEEFDAEV